MTIFQSLNDSYVLMREGGDKLLPGVGRRSDCASAILMPSEQSANETIAQIQEDCRDIFGELKAIKVDNVFALMRRAAQEGIGAFDSVESGFLKNSIVFCNRPTEIGDIFPTLLAEWACNEELAIFTRTGEKMVKAVDIVPWKRFDISDSLLSVWSSKGEPFRNWDSGEPMLAILIDGCIPVLRKCSLTEHWASLEGTIPIFTSASDFEYAINMGLLDTEISLFGPFSTEGYNVHQRSYRQLRQATYIQVTENTNLIQGIDHGTRTDLVSNVVLFEINSLPDHIANVCDQLPILELGQFSINPFCHRENCGYGWTSNLIKKRNNAYGQNANEATEKLSKRCGNAGTFFTVAGSWEIQKSNHVELRLKTDRWEDHATLHWSGGPSINLSNLSSSLAHKDDWGELSNDEKKEEISELFINWSACDFPSNVYHEDLSSQSHLFAAQLWDTLTGDKFVLRVDSPYQFLAFLNYAITDDEQVRIYGAQACGSPATGTAGSGNKAQEELLSNRIRNALCAIAEDLAITGYTPGKISKACWVVNQLFETMHLDFAGYIKDLIVQCESQDDLKSLCESLNIEEDEALQFKESTNLMPPTKGLDALREIISEGEYLQIFQKSIYFAANGLLDLELKGRSPIIDYSTASIQFVKSLEVQLGELFKIWIALVNPHTTNFGSTRSSSEAKTYLDTGKMFSIGTMAYLLREVSDSLRENNLQSSPYPLPHALASHVTHVEAVKPLLSKNFYKKFLSKVSHSYRNGGAHDQKIELATCLECRDSILGTSTTCGWLAIVANATKSLEKHIDSLKAKA